MIRLDFVTAYLSDQIVCGYTAGAAVHIFTAQLDAIFGLHIDKIPGVGKIILVKKIHVLKSIVLQKIYVLGLHSSVWPNETNQFCDIDYFNNCVNNFNCVKTYRKSSNT